MNSVMTKESYLQCTGCGACVEVCPQNVLSLQEKDGFYTVSEYGDSCVNCGKCVSVCHRFDEKRNTGNIFESKVFYGYSNTESVLKTSTSGGMAYEISKMFLDKGYNVIGVTYDCERHRAKHIVIDKQEDLAQITGSKYIQSDVCEVLKGISADKKYLFIGTPCQVYGMRKVAQSKKMENNFVFMDFFCHGYSGYDIWDDYRSWLGKQGVAKIQKLQFRAQDHGWHNFLMKIEHSDENGKDDVYFGEGKKDPFYEVFLSEALLLESCYSCRMRFDDIYSDIRVGDFWSPTFKDNTMGVSSVLAVTDKGRDIINELENAKTVTLKEIPMSDLQKVKEGPDRGRKSIPKTRNGALKVYNRKGFKALVRYLSRYDKLVQIKRKILH